jgi:hypothetical protein
MDREIRPRLRLIWMMVIGLVLLFLGLLVTSSGTEFPPGMLLVAFGLIAVGRAGVIMLIGARPDSPYAVNPRVAAATLAPFVVVGLALCVAYAGGVLPGGLMSAIVCLVFAGGVIYWICQYLLGEMVYSNGIWASRERWIDPKVSNGTEVRWSSERAHRASGRG